MMRPELRAALDSIEEVLLRGDGTAKELALVLSALRGPDSGDNGLKAVTTARIRAAAFPRLAKLGTRPFPEYGDHLGVQIRNVLRMWDMNVDGEKVPYQHTAHHGDHFQGHVADAAYALGIYDGPSSTEISRRRVYIDTPFFVSKKPWSID